MFSDDRIHLDVTTEVSQVDFGLGTAVEGVVAPGFRTRRATTGVEVGDGQTFAIAGLLRDELTENVSMYPLLGQIPIVGTLFRNSTYQKQTTELVLLVRPRLVKPLDPGRAAAADRLLRRAELVRVLPARPHRGLRQPRAAAPAEPEGGFRRRRGLSSPGQPRGSSDEEEAE